MNKRWDSATILLITALVLFLSATAQGAEPGMKAPFFRITSGSDKVLTATMIEGTVSVIFYETKDVVERNRELKNSLNAFFLSQPESLKTQITRLPVINCKGAIWPFTAIWKSKLKENSSKEGMTIYGDFDGKMFSDFGMKDNDSNVLILDKMGLIRYFAFGKIESKEIPRIKKLFEVLM
jgi:predicted transcriptional regulator